MNIGKTSRNQFSELLRKYTQQTQPHPLTPKSYTLTNLKFLSRNGELKKHQKTHANEKTYKCNECGKSFYQKSILS